MIRLPFACAEMADSYSLDILVLAAFVVALGAVALGLVGSRLTLVVGLASVLLGLAVVGAGISTGASIYRYAAAVDSHDHFSSARERTSFMDSTRESGRACGYRAVELGGIPIVAGGAATVAALWRRRRDQRRRTQP
jgi:hypothetical protein